MTNVMNNTRLRQWLRIQNEQVTLPEFEIPHPFYGIGDGELLKKIRMENSEGKECQMAQNVTKEGNKPEKKFRAGGITATIWKNTLKDGDRSFDVRSVNLERSYKDKEGNWQNTNSMRSSDLPRAILMLQKAYEFCTIASEDD